jgi:hypothetical protein
MPCTVELVPVAASLVADVWPHARAMVKSAIDRVDLCNFEGIEEEVLTGTQQLWLAWNGTAIEAAAVTKLVLIGGRKICIVVAAGAAQNNRNGKRWPPLIAGIEQFAKDEGCAAVRIIGRKGWQRILAHYRANYVVMDREL